MALLRGVFLFWRIESEQMTVLLFCGTSAIIDPYGATVAATSVDREEHLGLKVRSRMAVFEHRRPDLY